MAKENKERTPTQQKKWHKTLKDIFFGGEIASVIIPYVAVGIANYDEYFVQYDGTKMSIAFLLAMLVMGIAITLVIKQKLQASLVTIIFGFVVADAICWLLGSLITDLAYIILYGIIGLCVALGLDVARKKEIKIIEKIQKGIDQAETETIAEEYKKEQQAKKIKIKIKK